jgi:hypothetical protein
MKRQKQEPRIREAKAQEQGGQGEGMRAPEGRSFEKASGSGAAGKKRMNPQLQSIPEMSTRKLKRLHGESQGRNLAVEEELRRRGFNTQMLKEAEWQHAQQRWDKTIRESGHAAAAGERAKDDELARWRRLPRTVRSTSAGRRDAPPRKTKRQRQLERLRQRQQEREAGLRPRKKRR